MATSNSRWSLTVRLRMACIAVAMLWPHHSSAADLQKHVLVMHATRRDAQVSILTDRKLPEILAESDNGLNYYSEYLDLARFHDRQYQTGFCDFLRLKYKTVRLDLIVAMSDAAIEFVEICRPALFPAVPVVFLADTSWTRRLPNSTGVVDPLSLSATLALAIQLQPDLQQVFVITGADDRDKEYERIARRQLQRFESRLSITFLSGLRTPELTAKLSALPGHSAVYYVLVYRDGADSLVHPLEYLDTVTAAASAPTYCWVDSAVGHGIVGGSLRDLSAQIEAVGRLGRRVLDGEAADRIPLIVSSSNVPEVDWRQLRRWGIKENRVPAGARVLFREPTTWDRYWPYILSATTLTVVQTMFIVALLAQRVRRRQAEAQIRDLGRRLILAQEMERARIARELHDDVCQQLTLLSLDVHGLMGLDRRANNAAAASVAFDRLKGIARTLNSVCGRLHPQKLQLLGLVAALHGLQREFTRPDFAVTVEDDGVPSALNADRMLCFYRIAQEGLRNSLTHGRARHATVSLRTVGENLRLTIVDDGIGFNVDRAWGIGLGLISMSERAEAIGGRLHIESAPGHGTQLELQALL